MIFEIICTPLLLFIKGIISVFPVLTYIPTSVVDTLNLLIQAMQFFPIDVWIIVIGNIVFWISLHLMFALINFILRLIPFINMGV